MKVIKMEFRFVTHEEGKDFPSEVIASGVIENIARARMDGEPENETFIRNMLVSCGMSRDRAEVWMGEDGI